MFHIVDRSVRLTCIPQLPKPSQLPKRGRHSSPNEGKDSEETPSLSPEKKKSKNEDDAMYNHSSFPPNYMQYQHGMMNNMQSGMMMNNNMMGSAFGGPNAGNNEEQQNNMPKQMMSTSQGGMGMEGPGNYMGSGPNGHGGMSLHANRHATTRKHELDKNTIKYSG